MLAKPIQIKNSLEKFDYRDSELVIGMVCAVGTDYRPVAKSISDILARFSYSTQIIKVSELIEKLTDQPPAARTHGHSYRDFPLPGFTARH